MATTSTSNANDTESSSGKLSKHWRIHFLAKLAETSNVSASAKEVNCKPSRAYKARREEPEFAAKWQAALLEGYEHLEMETLHRLRMGTGKDDNKFDIANALRLLMLHRETVATARAKSGDGDRESALATLTAKLEGMRAREAAARQMLIDEGAIKPADYDQR